ncbi:hypothetical protein INS49_007084 [Diaporthe citri]|uniref:uncharacterized protein n=1 Tax=Diaporthe citri TaxID=83186 RepID=UPI001C7F65D9|nr:uncharacterized protein INS49_007084 [Diaporthe citri]KAG6365473.1 hypothetical protein INS49_007084 [Diaporthe citri]
MELPIGENLKDALVKLREMDFARIIWIDAICINQDDIKERNHQVHIMQTIYSKAAEVIVWLGPGSWEADKAMELIEQCNLNGIEKLLDHEEDSLIGLSDIFMRSWWKRIWIVQEVVAARDLVIHCGTRRVPWHFVAKICREIRRKEFSQNAKSQILRSSGYRNFTALNDFRRERMSLAKCLQYTRDYEATDMRDKLYALLGVASDISPEDIVPDYTKSTRTVFLDLVHFLATRRRSLDIISAGRHLRPSTTPARSQLQPGDKTPSWLADWHVSQGLRPLDSEGMDKASYCASRGANAVVRMDAFPMALEVEGVLVDKIDFFGEAITSSAQDSLPTLRRWQYIAGLQDLHLVSGSRFGVVTPPDFWTTIVAGKNYMATWVKNRHATEESEALEYATQSYVAGDLPPEMWESQYLAHAITRAVMGRRFFTTAKKRMGLGVPDIQLEDRVVVIKGCSVPLILRDMGEHMVIVGETYVSGIMDGEVIKGLGEGRYETRMIRLQ